MTTAVLKVHLHCEGCIRKIRKHVAKTMGENSYRSKTPSVLFFSFRREKQFFTAAAAAFAGYRDVKIDKQKETVTVTGAIDMKALAEGLKKHLKRDVQIVPAKKEGEKKENSGGAKAKGGGGGEKGNNNSGGGKGGGGGGDGGEKAASGEKMEGNNKVQFQVSYPNPYPYPYPHPIVYESGLAMGQFHYSPYAYGPNQAPQLFSDENPNACSIM